MTALSPQVPISVKNDSGQAIPPRSIVVITSVTIQPTGPGQESTALHHVMQYSCGQVGNIAVTGLSPIYVGRQGVAYFDQFIYVSIDPAISTPTPGEEWGPVEGSWTITRGGKGFFAQGYAETGALIKRSMFLRTFVRAPATVCSSSSSNSNTSGSSSGSVTGSSSGSGPCGCVLVVTSVGCSGGSLVVTYGSARGCC